MTREEKLAALEEMMELDEGSINEDTVLDSLEEWDSITAVSLMSLMAEEFGKRINGKLLQSFKTVGDVMAIMRK